MRIAACLVTRGNVPMDEIIESIPDDWEIVMYDNSKRPDVAVYGRYAAIELTDAEVIYVQDDDCVLDPQLIADAYEPGKLTANMPEHFRHAFYAEQCLVGFGAIFDRGLPERAFSRFALTSHHHGCMAWGAEGIDRSWFDRTCDIIFATLTDRVLVDVEYRNLSWASASDRMWKQPTHLAERSQTLQLALACR